MTTAVEQVKQNAKQTVKPKTISQMIQDSMKQLGTAVPQHMNPERIARIALTTLRMNPKLAKCEPKSFIGALFQSAQLGLEPNTLGEAWILPYEIKDKVTNQKVLVAQFQIGYQGYVKLYWNHNNSVGLQVEKVHEKDDFDYDLGAGTITHRPPKFGADRGKVIGYYAVATLANGGRAMKVLSVKEAMDWAIRYSKSYDRKNKEFFSGSSWDTAFDAMAMKTLVIMLLKILPKSVEIQKAMQMDGTVKSTIDLDMSEVPNEDQDDTQFTEAEVIDPKQIEHGGQPSGLVDPDYGVKQFEAFKQELEDADTVQKLKAVHGKVLTSASGGDITEKQKVELLALHAQRKEILK